jgi:hypothetical protein
VPAQQKEVVSNNAVITIKILVATAFIPCKNQKNTSVIKFFDNVIMGKLLHLTKILEQ